MESKQKKYWLEKIKNISDESILKDILLSEEDSDTFAEIFEIQKASEELNRWKKFDSHKAWKNIEKNTQGRSNLMLKYMSVAAAILILGVSILFTNRATVYSSSDIEKHLVLSDGSDIILSPNSELTLSNGFNDEQREVSLIGDAYFNIAKNKAKPFVIKMKKAEIKVLGTVFYVDQSERGVKVDLISGKVEIERNDGKRAVLNKNKTAFVYDNIDIENLNEKEIPKLKDIYFDNVSIKDAVSKLNEIYGEKVIELKEPENKLWNETIHTTVKNSSVREFINELKLVFNVKKVNSKGKFIISGLKMK